MTLPNRLTILRILLIPLFILFCLTDWAVSPYLALFIFAAASITDKLDGYIARKYDLITSFGKIMDPLADKLLVGAAYLVFLAQGRMGVIPVLLIVAREYAVSGLRVVAMSEGRLMPAAFRSANHVCRGFRSRAVPRPAEARSHSHSRRHAVLLFTYN